MSVSIDVVAGENYKDIVFGDYVIRKKNEKKQRLTIKQLSTSETKKNFCVVLRELDDVVNRLSTASKV